MENKIKKFLNRYGFQRVENNVDYQFLFQYVDVEDGYKWQIDICVVDDVIKSIEFIEDGWVNQRLVYPDNFDDFCNIVDDWIWNMGIHPDNEWRD